MAFLYMLLDEEGNPTDLVSSNFETLQAYCKLHQRNPDLIQRIYDVDTYHDKIMHDLENAVVGYHFSQLFTLGGVPNGEIQWEQCLYPAEFIDKMYLDGNTRLLTADIICDDEEEAIKIFTENAKEMLSGENFVLPPRSYDETKEKV